MTVRMKFSLQFDNNSAKVLIFSSRMVTVVANDYMGLEYNW